jgi:UDP-N-acetylmuramoyl-L-alanyl-D-glutamate--2,6-diaminopimelate ligase
LVDRELFGLTVPQIVVDHVRRAMGPAAAAVYGRPSERLEVVGVTGTNGKTTTTWIIAHLLELLGWPTGLIGTLAGAHTTPEAPDLQAAFAEFADAGKRAVSIEVSSHALALGRADAVTFAVGVFTNLTRDHLDLHGTMAAYEASKFSLFEPGRCRRVVVSRDDLSGTRLIRRLEQSGREVLTFGHADAMDIDLAIDGARFTWRGHHVRFSMGGAFTVLNVLAAAAAVSALGFDDAAIAEHLALVPPVPGRFEPVVAGQSFGVIVDYAHTPDGVAAVLDAARHTTAGRLIVVFGCGGDRDRTKRPFMGEEASKRADVVVVTSDNPRSEDPAAIISDVLAGVPPHRTAITIVEPDRRAAIGIAFAMAERGDVVVIAGKGHETTQTIGAEVRPFDDRMVARELLGVAS